MLAGHLCSRSISCCDHGRPPSYRIRREYIIAKSMTSGESHGGDSRWLWRPMESLQPQEQADQTTTMPLIEV